MRSVSYSYMNLKPKNSMNLNFDERMINLD